MVAAACICTCPPRAVCSSLSSGGTRTHRQQRRTKLQGPRAAPRTPASTGTDQMRTPAASSLSPLRRGEPCFFRRGEPCFYEANLACFSSMARHFVLSSPSPTGRGHRSEGLASGLDEGLSGDSWPPFIGRAEHSLWLGGATPEVVSPPLIGWGACAMLTLHSLAGGNALCPSLERSLNPKRWRRRPRPQPKTRGQWRPG